MPKQGFLQGALILALAGAASRAIGVIYVIILPRVLQGAGYGLYTAVKPIYHALLILAVAGFPVAIAKAVADQVALGDIREVKRIFWVSLGAMALTGSLAALGLLIAAPEVAAALLGLPEAALLLQVVAPAILLSAIASALRGFLQGLQRMTPIAVSQISEQVVRVAGTVLGALALVPAGQVYGAAGAMLGGVMGGGCAVLVLGGYYVVQRRSIRLQLAQRKRGRTRCRQRGTFRRLVFLAVPLVLGQILWPLFEFLDTLIVPARLMAMSFTREAAMTGLGYLGMAGQLMWLPNVLTLALAASLVPAVAEAWALGQRRQVQRFTNEAVRVACMLGMPAAVGLNMLADQCAWLLFGFPQAGAPLAILAFGTWMIGIQQVTSGTLQGLGYVGLPVRNLMLGAVVKLAVTWWFMGLPSMGLRGAAWGTLLGFCVAAFMNVFDIRRLTGLPIHIRSWLIQPLLGTLVMAVSVFASYNTAYVGLLHVHTHYGVVLSEFMINAVATLGSIALGVVAYGLTMVRNGGVRSRDVDAIPIVGPRWSRMLIRKGWLV